MKAVRAAVPALGAASGKKQVHVERRESPAPSFLIGEWSDRSAAAHVLAARRRRRRRRRGHEPLSPMLTMPLPTTLPKRGPQYRRRSSATMQQPAKWLCSCPSARRRPKRKPRRLFPRARECCAVQCAQQRYARCSINARQSQVVVHVLYFCATHARFSLFTTTGSGARKDASATCTASQRHF